LSGGKVIVRSLEADAFYGFAVTATRSPGGREHCVAMTCGGALGRALATMCAAHAAEALQIDDIEMDPALAAFALEDA